MNEIVLTVQPCGNGKYRFAISKKNLEFNERGEDVRINLICCIINIQTTCGNKKKGFDLYDKKIDKWIKDNNYNNYTSKKPTKLIFNYSKIDNIHNLQFFMVAK